ncbi:MAG: hypothetical protein NVSMB62_06480 [Acidobacteriaceae bacterium]
MNLSPTHRGRPSTAAIGVFALCTAALIYILPLHVPMRPAVSESYLYGFSNRASLAALLCCALFFSWWARGVELELPAAPTGIRPQDNRYIALGMLAAGLFTAGLWLLNIREVAFDEAVYALTRLHDVLAGQSLYHGVEYIYGPLLFLLPLWLSRLSHLSIESSYFILWIAEWIAGTWLLGRVIFAVLPARTARQVFVLFGIFYLLTLAVVVGHNYTPLRFMLAPSVALVVYSAHQKGRHRLLVFTVASAGTALALFFSPEQGIALLLATVVFFVVCLRRLRLTDIWGYLLYGASAVVCLWALRSIGALEGAASMGSGALNMPVLFCPQNACIFALLMVVAVALNRARIERRLDHPLVYLCCLSLFLLPFAFGRCDIEHLVLGTTPALLTAFAVLSRSARTWRWTTAVFVLGVLMPVVVSQVRLTRGLVINPIKPLIYNLGQKHPWFKEAERSAIRRVLGRARADSKIATSRDALRVSLQTRTIADPVLAAPLSYRPYVSPHSDLPQVRTGKYNGLENVVTASAIQDKIAELDADPERPLILPADWQLSCALDGGDVDHLMKSLFLPVHVPARKHSLAIFEPLCTHIASHYEFASPLSPFPGYSLWRRRL